MALHDVYVVVDFTDAAERTAQESYLIIDQLDDADVAGSMPSVVTQAASVIAALNTLTWASIDRYRICIEWEPGGGGANIAANNQVRAFTRMLTTSGAKAGITVPAWDDALYDQNAQNMLSAVYDIAVAALVPLLRDPKTGENMASVEYSQSRTHKSRTKIND